jgi:F0F1-type ATP synthase assembly protein I
MAADNDSNRNPDKKDNLKSYMRYSGLAFQMIGALVIAAYGGKKLDEYMGNKNPWATIILMVLAVVASVYLVIVSVIKNNPNK